MMPSKEMYQYSWPYENMEKAVKDSEKRLSLLLENLSIGVIVHDVSTAILFSNQAASTFLGLTKDQLTGKVATDERWHFIEDDGSIISLDNYPVNRVLNTNKSITAQVIGVVRPDLSEPVWAVCNAYPELDTDGKVSLIIVNFTDISEQKKLKEKLSEMNILFQAALDQSQAGIAIADASSGRLRYLNQAGFILRGGKNDEQVSGIDVSEFMSFWKMQNLDGTLLSYEETPIGKALFKKEKVTQEFIVKDASNIERVLWVNSAPILKADGSLLAVIVVFLDTTERFKLEKELRLAKAVAENATAMKSRFLDVAAHELRTPVTAFSLLIQMTQREFDKGVNVQASTLQRLRKQVERITRLVVDLLDVSRLERGALSLKKQKTDIVELIKECILDYELKDPDREILFQKEVELLFVQVDPIRLFQVISNLIDNATKYSAKTLPIEIKLEIKANRFKILVKDFGPGISQIEQEALFMPFSRGSTELTEKSGGLGLGLYIGRMIIELHGGFIGLESVVGKGSTFFFEIPIEEFHS